MKCKHCGSGDIVTIQGQGYCLNCGYQVAGAAKVVVSAQVLQPGPVGATAPPVAAPIAAQKKAPKAKRKVQKRTGATKRVHTAKIGPALTATTGASYLESAAAHPTQTASVSPQRPQRGPISAPAALHPVRFSSGLALGVGTLVGGVVGAALGFRFDSDTALYAVAGAIIISAVLTVLAAAALTYGVSRKQDGRPAPHSYWWAAARGGFMDLLNLLLMSLIANLLVGMIAIGGWQLLLHYLAPASPVTIGALVVLNVASAWAFIGIYAASRVAAPAVIIGGLTAWQSFQVGWRLYVKAGGHLAVASVEALLLKLAAAVLLAGVAYLSAHELMVLGVASTALLGGLISGLAAALAVFVLLEGEMRIWLRQYRRWILLFTRAERLQLLAGRATRSPH